MNLNLEKNRWKRVRLGDVIRRSRTQVDPLRHGVERYVAGGDIDSEGVTIERWSRVEDGEMGSTFRYVFEPGQVLFLSARPYLRKVGVPDFSGVVADKTYVLDALPENGLIQEFLPFVLSSEAFVEYAIAEATGSMNPRLLWGPMQRFEFDLPPVDEQKRLADLLWAAERHRVNTGRLADAASLVEDAWLDSVYADLGASHVPIGLLIREGTLKLLTGPFGSTLSASEYTRTGVPVIHPSFIVDGRLTVDDTSFVSVETADRLARWKVQEGDIVFMRKGDVTRSAIVTSDEAGWILGSDCISIRVFQDVFLPSYVRAMLRAPSARRELLRRAPGTTMPGINERSLSEILLPSAEIREQIGILDRLKTITGVRGEYERMRVALTMLRASLSSAAFGSEQ